MLHWISVSNYQSIRDQMTLDFRVPKTTPERSWLRSSASGPAVRVPTVIALIGPNGSGKTACLRALADTVRFTTQSYGYQPGPVQQFPAFASPVSLARPTRIEIECDGPRLPSEPEEGERVYRYTLVMDRTAPNVFPDAVAYEALHIFPRGRPRRLFERCGNRRVRVARELAISQTDDRLASVPANASALSTLARLGVEAFSALVAAIAPVQTNVTAADPICLPSETLTEYFRANPQVADRISGTLGQFDLGIEGMTVQQWTDGKWRLVFSHSGLDRMIPYEAESSGTRHIVSVFPLLNFVLQTGGLAVMDALDNDLHAALVDEILNWFRRHDTNPRNAQLICALHNLSALEDLEKEEVYIVEKNREGVTGAYGVRDVHGVRRNADLRKLYRSGALGGVPRFG